ncbi:nucleotidyltransferase [Pseudomonas sp. PNP]|uniref:nucleotidyltransferase domain-containing protein n=1 Tax=Pseudomonas sp. PNP TaxID=361819 RepID=UPI001AECE87D|nr:nucleotidyltransferase [Pseudomonas sp. PNP]MBP2840534.1 nucleotidyltransferase [Pseudomonas sp. PNP]
MTTQDEQTRRFSWEHLLLRAARDISLTESQYEIIEGRYEQLRNILSASNDPLLAEAHIFPQGSMRLRTVINPVKDAPEGLDTIDADAIVWLPNAGGADAIAVLDAIEKRFSEGTRVTAKIERLRRGIRIVYADENPGFHIDVTPARAINGNLEIKGEGKLEVPDREMGWKPSSPISYANWLNSASEQHILLKSVEGFEAFAMDSRELVVGSATQDPLPAYRDYHDNDPLRATIKLLKRHRDEWAIETRNESHRPISAVITTLATHAYLQVVQESRFSPLRPLDAIIKIVEKMPSFVTQVFGQYQVLNPKDPGENFAEKWNRPDEGAKYRQAFYNWHASATVSIMLGLRTHESEEAFARAMNSSFGIGKKLINEANRELPKNWTLPGRKEGITQNSVALAALTGIAISSKPQASVKPVERLG